MEGDNIAMALVDEYVRYLAIGIGIVENMLDPDVIALGGGVSNTGPFLLDKVIEASRGKGVFAGQDYADIRLAVSGNDAGIIGAAMLGMS
jgi:glucokinase